MYSASACLHIYLLCLIRRAHACVYLGTWISAAHPRSGHHGKILPSRLLVHVGKVDLLLICLFLLPCHFDVPPVRGGV